VRRIDVAIVGAGVMGCATAWSLAGRGRHVVLLEQFELGHDRGSSHGSVRVFRLSYDDPVYVSMALEALPLWRQLEAECGRTVLTTTGGYDFGPPDRLARNAGALASRGAGHEMIDGAEVTRRFPAVSLPAETTVLHQPDAGVVAAELAVRTFAERAQQLGAELKERSPVVRLRPSDDGVHVVTGDESYHARVVVVTAGPWVTKVLPGTGIELPVIPSRETVAFFHLAPEPAMPVLVEWTSPPTYALPSPGEGVKVGWHRSGPEADPDDPGPPDQRVVDHLTTWAGERYPLADRVPHRVETCMYTNTEDESFVLRRRGPVVVGSACSGHAFKFAPLIGDRLARLAIS
jgi:sarcosine oxidase